MSEKHWQRLSYLAALRPDAGWQVDHAVLATYSADLVVVVAALLALAGIEEDEDTATKVDFANAYETMRGRVRVLAQRGRLVRPSRRTPLLAILDRFIREVGNDESQSSWHPKAALVKFVARDGQSKWRLWLGSRNLTRSTNWETGFTLVGAADSSGKEIPGIQDLGQELARRAELKDFPPDIVAKELEGVRWQMPPGIDVNNIELLKAPKRPYPPTLSQLDELTVVSPFLDVTTVRQFRKWGGRNTRRKLISSQSELASIYGRAKDVLSDWDLLHLAPPESEDIEATVPEKQETDVTFGTEEEPTTGEDTTALEDIVIELLGLHAKIIYARHQEHRTLWIGSPNATIRGWQGPNVEIIAQLTIGDNIALGLETFLREIAQTVDMDTIKLLSLEETETEEEKLLETARKQVAARWSVRQERNGPGYLLVATETPHPDDDRVELSVGHLGGSLVLWPRKELKLRLPNSSDVESELAQVRLKFGDLTATWLHCAPLAPPPDEERDRRALARHLDPRTFLLWIRSLLGGDELAEGGGTWYSSGSSRNGYWKGPVWWAPTLEELLKSWSRRPDSLVEVDRKVQQYLAYIREDGLHEIYEEEKRLVEEFATTWEIVRQVLVDQTDE